MTAPGAFFQKLITAMDSMALELTLDKGELLLREGETEQHLYYICSGAIRVCYLTDMEELTIRFGYKGSFINSLSSFLKNEPSEFYIEAIRKTEIKAIPKSDIMELAHRDLQSLAEYTRLIEFLVTQQIDREIDLLISSPSERLNRVLQRSPDVFQHIPLKYIASYLRMKPETLSRIRQARD